jgi:hypothetical protein
VAVVVTTIASPVDAENVKSCELPEAIVMFVSTGLPFTVTVTEAPFHPSPNVSRNLMVCVQPDVTVTVAVAQFEVPQASSYRTQYWVVEVSAGVV